MYKNLLACGMALLMCGCSAKAAGNDQVLTVGLSSEMNGTFRPCITKRQMILMSLIWFIKGC